MERETKGTHSGRDAAGFALVVALLALMLLTFLGLTLATTTSTELQVAANYRWSQQAYYNAEGGIEAAKIILRRVQDPTMILPVLRNSAWSEFSPLPIPSPGTSGGGIAVANRATRNFENYACDKRGNGIGFGAVVDDNGTGSPYENVRTMFGQNMQGAFTIWVRRPLIPASTTTVQDNPSSDSVIITAEGVAPDPRSPNRAVRVLETAFLVRQPCDNTDPQASMTGFAPCVQ